MLDKFFAEVASKALIDRKFEKFQFSVAVIAAITAMAISAFDAHKKERLKEQNQTYEAQLKTLSEVQSSIDNLKLFVTAQKQQLQDEQAIIQNLKSEKEKLQPLVEADKQVVDALFRIQAEKSQSNVWVERIYGFVIGIISSLAASLIWSYLRVRWPNNSFKADA